MVGTKIMSSGRNVLKVVHYFVVIPQPPFKGGLYDYSLIKADKF